MRALLAAAAATLALVAGDARAGALMPQDPLAVAESAIAACRSAQPPEGPSAPVYTIDRYVCVYGDINRDMSTRFKSLDVSAADTVVVSSPGGSVASALDMAEHLGLFTRTLVVDGLCASSCANYLFLSAKYKIVPDGSTVAWHGAPPRPEGWSPPPDMATHAATFMGDTIIRSDAFFRRIGVADRVARETSEGQEIASPDPKTFWTHSYQTLVERFGVNGILYMPQ